MKKFSIFLMMLCLACFGVAKAQQSLPYSYGFEDNDLSVDGWTTQNPSGLDDSKFMISTSAKKTGTYGFQFSSYDDKGEHTQYLISPELNASSGVIAQFYYKASSSYGTELFKVGYSKTDTNISSFTFGEEISTSNTSWAQSEEYIFPAGTKYVAIYYYSDWQYYLYVDDISFTAVPSCIKPTLNPAEYIEMEQASLSWAEGGTANQWQLQYSTNADFTDAISLTRNGIPALVVNDLTPATTYYARVKAICSVDDFSDWSNVISFTTLACANGHVINYTLTDSYGDGWNGASITLIEGCEQTTLTCSGSSTSGTLAICADYFAFVWNTGSYDSECGFTFTEGGTTLFTKPSSLSNGQVLYSHGTTLPIPTNLAAGTPTINSVALTWTAGDSETAWQLCVNGDENNLIDVTGSPSYTLSSLTPDTDYTVKVRAYINATTYSCWSNEITFTTLVACVRPTGLAEANIGTNSADLSWSGEASSYVVEYRPWHQVGEDQIATGVLTPYTFDLSEYSGTGSVAIRHYDVSDMFMLNVDDIVVTNAAGTTIYSQNFEGGSIPSNITNMDLDGDGYVWGMRQVADDDLGNPSGNGNYCVSSASWMGNGVGALHPDNWLIISGIELGGQITFIARGQDPEWPSENFAVYVSAEADAVETTVSTTSYQATNLTPNTPYAWQVKSDCGEYQSTPVSSFFKTKDDMLVFATAGNWNVVANWEDAEGNTAAALPTADNNVRIDAAAVIPTNVVAEANKITINGGSITIKDGGQLKQSSATVKVTMEKEIVAVGEDNWNADNNSGYYFIASPFSGRTLYDETTDWNHVEDMFDAGEYDLYAFDATSTLEWINYKSNPTHISFQSQNENAGLMGGEGYLYASQEGTTLKFVGSTGKSYNYSETKDFTYAESTDSWNGWALVGNYFSCDAYINYIDADDNVLDADFYVMNTTGNGYTLSQSNVALAPLTGALINYSATGKVQYSTEAPTPTYGKGMINMNLTQGRGNVDQARIRFGEGYGLEKMSFRNSSRIYMPVDGKDYAVVYTENQGEMPVSFKAEENGTYTLSFNTENVEFGYLHLIDNMTGNDVNLLATPSYSFEAKTTDYANRFKLVFAAGTTDDSFAFYNNGSFVINNEGNATVQVIDINGRVINSTSINGSANVNVNVANGVYMLRLINGENVKVQKVVVR